MISWFLLIWAFALCWYSEKIFQDSKAFNKRMFMYRRVFHLVALDRTLRGMKQIVKREIDSQIGELSNEDIFTTELLKQDDVKLQ